MIYINYKYTGRPTGFNINVVNIRLKIRRKCCILGYTIISLLIMLQVYLTYLLLQIVYHYSYLIHIYMASFVAQNR